MKQLPETKDLLALAKRVVWFENPSDACKDPDQLVLHALQYGTDRDLEVLMKYVDLEQIKDLLKTARPGILDERSWSYWHVKTGTYPAPPMPERSFDLEER